MSENSNAYERSPCTMGDTRHNWQWFHLRKGLMLSNQANCC